MPAKEEDDDEEMSQDDLLSDLPTICRQVAGQEGKDAAQTTAQPRRAAPAYWSQRSSGPPPTWPLGKGAPN